MNDIYDLLDNIEQFRDNIDNFVSHLQKLGYNSMDELKKAARECDVVIPRDMRDAIKQKLNSTISDEEDWERAKNINTKEAYEEYLDQHPNGAHRDEARAAIDKLIPMNPIPPTTPGPITSDPPSGIDIISVLKRGINTIQVNPNINNRDQAVYDLINRYLSSGELSTNDLLSVIKEDHNFISSKVAYNLWENYQIDFSQTGIDNDFITAMQNQVKYQEQKENDPQPQQRNQPGNTFISITKNPCTEVYFWGIPSSGKSCALGAIMNIVIKKKGLNTPVGQGFGYMSKLAELFSEDDVSVLPPGTPSTSTYEIGFDLVDKAKRKSHPITCIDLAGELVRCMYKKMAQNSINQADEDVLNLLTNIMATNKNRKLHFFVVEYGAEKRKYDNISQITYLESALEYLRQAEIFKDNTDKIFLLITKVDIAEKALKKKNEKDNTAITIEEHLDNYVKEKYIGFFNVLEKICIDNEINGGKVEIIPFTLGEVCFQNYCRFESSTAELVIDKILENSYSQRTCKWGKFLKKIRE